MNGIFGVIRSTIRLNLSRASVRHVAYFSYSSADKSFVLGQWGSLVGTGLAALGSLLLLRKVEHEEPAVKTCNCDCSEHRFARSSHSLQAPEAVHVHSPSRSRSPHSLARTTTYRSIPQRWNAGNRGTVRETLIKVSKYIGTAAPDRFDDSEFKRGRAGAWPEIPAEEQRNTALPDIRQRYNHSRASSVVSSRAAEGNNTPTGPASPQSPDSPHPLPRMSSSPRRRPHSNTYPDKRSPEHRRTFSASSGNSAPLGRRATLEVPQLVLHQLPRNNQSSSSRQSTDTMSGAQSPPAIIVSPDPETTPSDPVSSQSQLSQSTPPPTT